MDLSLWIILMNGTYSTVPTVKDLAFSVHKAASAMVLRVTGILLHLLQRCFGAAVGDAERRRRDVQGPPRILLCDRFLYSGVLLCVYSGVIAVCGFCVSSKLYPLSSPSVYLP